MRLNPPDHIVAITPYPPGKPLEELEREYGISDSIKLASNENPWGPSPKAVDAIREALGKLHRYPDGSCHSLTEALARHLELEPGEIVLGNGSNEVIEFLVKAFVHQGDRVISSHPSFLMYQKFVQMRGGDNLIVDLREMRHDLDAIARAVDERTRLIFLDNPNNPCATAFGTEAFEAFLAKLPEELVVVLDEAYVDFMAPEQRIDIRAYLRKPEGRSAVVGLRTFSKAYGLAGLRVGFGIMHRELAALMHRVRQPFNVNLLAQAGALAALDDLDYYQTSLERTIRGRRWLIRAVEKIGCRPYPSETNFFLIDVGGDGTALYEAMLRKGVIIRAMCAYGYPDLIRVTVGTEAENERFVNALAACRQELGYA